MAHAARLLLPPFLCILLARTVAGESSLRGSLDHVVVFDAGSSDTRVHIFNLIPTGRRSHHLPYVVDLSVRDKQTMKVTPGLSRYAMQNNHTGAQDSIAQLLAFANTFVPEARRGHTPVLLKATGGIRTLPLEQAESMLGAVRRGLYTSEYKFLNDEWASIMKGKDEAGLAWVAANYLQGTFSDRREESRQSIGVIGMGGCSTQVSFEVESDDDLAEDDQYSFSTATGKEYRLYAHSYKGFGQDRAQARLRERLLDMAYDPCYPKGYRRRATSAEGLSMLVEGKGAAEECEGLIRQHLFKGSPEASYIAEHPVQGSLAATDHFFHVRNHAGLQPVGDIDAMHEQAKEQCNKALQPDGAQTAEMEVGAFHPSECFALSYQVVLLQELQAMPPAAQVNITQQINDADIDWALGIAVLHFLERRPDVRKHKDALQWLVALWVVIVLWFVVRLCVLELCRRTEQLKRAMAAKGVTIYGRRVTDEMLLEEEKRELLS